MKLVRTNIEGAWKIQAKSFLDDRGAFSRLFCQRELESVLGERRIVQINHSRTSTRGAVRGLHFQNPPHCELKVVRCLKGYVFDVVVDLRAGSTTFLQWLAIELAPENGTALVIPEGCAHGFQVLEEGSELLYLHTEYYNPESEGAVRFDDPRVSIDWPLKPTDISKRDVGHPYLSSNFSGIVL